MRWVALACGAILAASCGNRLTRDEIIGQNTVPGGSGAVATPGGASTSGDGTTGVDPSTGGTDSAATATSGTAGAPTGSTGGGSGATGGTTSGGDDGAATTAGGGSDKSPIVVGLINNETGIGANVTLPVREVWQAWAKSVNARGGIKGHPVRLIVADCANNTSLNVPSARDLVEKQGAIALAFECSEISGLPEYAASKRIPIVGSLVSGPAWHSNPMLFPTHPNSIGHGRGEAFATKQLGIKRVAVLYCVESPTCKTGSANYVAAAREFGVEVVYDAGTTVTQPDYTAECLQARNRGAEALLISGLPDQAIRVARSCVRQQYKPLFMTAPASDSQLRVPELDGMVSFAPNFPFFLRTGTPAIEEYGRALAKYAPKLLTAGTTLQTSGWVAGKVLEKAAEVGLSPDRKPTTQAILDGLWSIKNDTFGGLFDGPMARTFTRDKPTPDVACTHLVRRQGDKWTAPNGWRPTCA